MTEAPQPPANPLQKASNVPFVIAFVVMTMLGLLVVMGILWLRPDDDNAQLIATVIGFVATMTGVIMTFIKSTQTDIIVNSSLAQWKQDFAALQHAKGEQAGAASEQDRIAKMRADALAGEASSAAAKAVTAMARSQPAAPPAVVIAPVPAVAPAQVAVPASHEVGTVHAASDKADMHIEADKMNVTAAGTIVIKPAEGSEITKSTAIEPKEKP